LLSVSLLVTTAAADIARATLREGVYFTWRGRSWFSTVQLRAARLRINSSEANSAFALALRCFKVSTRLDSIRRGFHSRYMTEKRTVQKRSFGEELQTWVQIVGILMAAAWGVYTFIYKEISVPKSAPVNVTVNLQLKKIGVGVTKEGITAVELKAAATNPSTREIHLLPSAWIAYGSTVTPAESEETRFVQSANAVYKDITTINTIQRHVTRGPSVMVAGGHLFPDSLLRPGETTARTIVFHVPTNMYDIIHMVAIVPRIADVKGKELEWALDKDFTLNSTLYRRNPDGSRTPYAKDPNGELVDKHLGFENAEAHTQISLWP
jgi:hypothetical protein